MCALQNIVEMYPEGPRQLNELIQNADDAKATVVRFVVSKKQHDKSSVLGQKLIDWQGPALYCYNDSTFSSRDFQNLAKIGQASKLEKLSTTGRFGLGFNSGKGQNNSHLNPFTTLSRRFDFLHTTFQLCALGEASQYREPHHGYFREFSSGNAVRGAQC